MSNTDFTDADPEARDGRSGRFATIDLTRTPLAANPFAPDPNDHNLDGGQVLYHMALGARPEDFHPNLRPMAQGYSLLFQPRPKLDPGLLGSLDDIRRAVAAQSPQAVDGASATSPVSASPGLDAALPDLHIPVLGRSAGPQGLQDVDGLPLEPGQNAVPQFDGLIAAKVRSFFQAMRDQGIPAQLRSGIRTSDNQARQTGNKNGGAKAGNSLHEAGLAFDLNWNKLSPNQRANALSTARNLGFQWGGPFRRKSDPEHFYIDPFSSLADRQAYIRQLQQSQGQRGG